MSKPIPSLTLTQEEQNYLERFVNQGKRSARAIKRARILLCRHAGKTPKDTRRLVEVSLGTVLQRERKVSCGRAPRGPGGETAQWTAGQTQPAPAG